MEVSLCVEKIQLIIQVIDNRPQAFTWANSDQYPWGYMNFLYIYFQEQHGGGHIYMTLHLHDAIC